MKHLLRVLLLIFLAAPAFAADGDFFLRFGDDYLSGYVCEGLKNNHDARQAAWKVEEYRQNIKASFARELPRLSVGANYSGVHAPFPGISDLDKNGFVLPFIASYEPDFLLKNRDRTRGATKDYEAQKFTEESIYISIVSDIATVYINILQYDALIERQEQIVALNNEQVVRACKKFKHGVIDQTSLNAVQKNLETEKNNLDELVKQRQVALTQLALLVGRKPGGQIERAKLENFEYNGQIPAEISSDVIFARPDVLAAEAQLESANINVRVARKEFLPSFNILGLLTFNTLLPGGFFDWSSTIAFLLAGATQDIFTGGAKVANLKINKARYEQLFEMYRQTDLTAVKEVNDALVIIKTDTRTDNNTIEKLRLQQRDFEDACKKFERGVISVPELLSAQQAFLSMQQSQIRTKSARLVNYLTLYKAVGGKL